MAGGGALRAGLAVARDGAMHDGRAALRERLVGKPQARHDAGAEALEDHVRFGEQLEKDLAAFRGVEVQGEAFLAAIRQASDRGTHVVAELRILDLDHMRAEVGEVLRAQWPWQQARQVEHADAGKRRGARRFALAAFVHARPR